MNLAIGFLELNCIAKGIEAADAILKAAETKLILASPVCPGKYNILFSGEVAAVNASLEAGKKIGQVHVVDSVVIPNVHPSVIPAINHATEPTEIDALGIMEFFSITASVWAADAAVKAAEVHLIDVRLGNGIGGKSFVILSGDVAAVYESVQAGVRLASENGLLVSQVVIPNPKPEIFNSLI